MTLKNIKWTVIYDELVDYIKNKSMNVQMQLRNTDASNITEIAKLQWQLIWIEDLFNVINTPNSRIEEERSNKNRLEYFFSLFTWQLEKN